MCRNLAITMLVSIHPDIEFSEVRMRRFPEFNGSTLFMLFKVQEIIASEAELVFLDMLKYHRRHVFTFLLGVQIAVVALKIFMICTWCCVCKFMLCLYAWSCLCVGVRERERESERERVSVF